MRKKRTHSQKLHDELDKLCGDIVKARDGGRCRRCKKHTQVFWAHIIRRSASKAVRWDPVNGLALCRDCHYWFDNSADKIQAALFTEEMIGKAEMERLNKEARVSRNWLIYDLEAKKKELETYYELQ